MATENLPGQLEMMPGADPIQKAIAEYVSAIRFASDWDSRADELEARLRHSRTTASTAHRLMIQAKDAVDKAILAVHNLGEVPVDSRANAPADDEC